MTILVRIIAKEVVIRLAIEIYPKSCPFKKNISQMGRIAISRKLAPRILPIAISTANLKAVRDTASSGREVVRARKIVPTRVSLQSISLAISFPRLASHIPRKTIAIKDKENLKRADFR